MDTSGLPESLRARIASRTSLPPIEKVRAFLHGYVADADGYDEIRDELRATARANTLFLQQYLQALEVILAEPQLPGTLLRLVEGDANHGIDDQTEAGAAAYLYELVRMLRAVIDEAT